MRAVCPFNSPTEDNFGSLISSIFVPDFFEEPLLQDRIVAIPEGQGKAELLLVVGDTSQTIFTPAIRAGAGLIMGEEVPGVTIFAVLLTHRSPLALGQIRSPLLSLGCTVACFLEARVFGMKWTPKTEGVMGAILEKLPC